MASFNILIIGRSNVGKSTLFNRLLNKTKSITDNNPGTTRDFKYYDFYLSNQLVRLFDTAGCDLLTPEKFLQKDIKSKNENLLADCDLILFVVDSKSGLTNNDIEFANYLREFHFKTFLISNKHDNKNTMEGYWDSLSLGLENSFPISAVHGLGIDDLKNGILKFLKSQKTKLNEDEKISSETNLQRNFFFVDPYSSLITNKQLSSKKEPIKLAIVGRPNVGKSTLLNTIMKEQRVVTSPKSGTTTDPILVDLNWMGEDFKIIDTAGMRRISKIQKGLEELSVRKSIEVIKFSEVVVMLLDSEKAFDSQDLKIINLIENEGRCLILVLNKWDLEKNKKEKINKLKNKIKLSLPQFGDISLVAISALRNEGIERLKDTIVAAKKNWEKRFTTSKLNNWLQIKTLEHPPPMLKGRRLKLRYITQIKSRPPNFLIFSSRLDVPENYRRFLFNSIRDQFSFKNVPIRLSFRVGNNPYIKD
ncbi:MAG: ribosome biogenesis GTPase Der [Paracoccaceae bacterium]